MHFIKKIISRYKLHENSDRRTILKFLALPLAGNLMFWEYAYANNVIAVRVWPSDDYTRITIETNDVLIANHQLLQEPYRLVIDIPDLQLSSNLKDLLNKVLPDNPHISRVRVGQNMPNMVRIVFDLKQSIKPQVFSLSPIANYKHRLVFDLKSTDDTDFISKILNQQREYKPQIQQDPLKDWLRRQNRSSNSNNNLVIIPDNNSPYSNFFNKKITIAIDPGHGGEDPGAIGPSGLREKDVVLIIARLLANIASRYVRVIMTRDADFFVPLNTRVLKARAAKADVFVSIHADAFTKSSARGSSVFALSERGASSSLASMLAKIENNADSIGGINGNHNKQTQKILLGFSKDAQIRDSLILGSYILNNISSINTLHNKKVEQAGFAVLKAPDIPSVLVETAFISNPDEERKLQGQEYKAQMAEAIWQGIRRFLKI